MLQRILVWDVPTRVFHWSLALSFAGRLPDGRIRALPRHPPGIGLPAVGADCVPAGAGACIGTTYARFAAFAFTPAAVVQYVRSLLSSAPQHHVGHNPAGGVAIFLLLALGLLISISGLGLYWEFGAEDLFEELHEVAANLMLLVVFVHIAGVLISSLLHKENLVRSMVTGYKTAHADQAISRPYTGLGIGMTAAVVVFLLVYLSGLAF